MVIGVQASVKHFGKLLQLMMSDVIYEPPQVGLEIENKKSKIDIKILQSEAIILNA